MPLELTFISAIAVGILGSSHCIGMCGGIVGALNLGMVGTKPKSVFVYQLSFNSGRISSYVLVGLLAGMLGAGMEKLGLNPLIGKLTAAAFMIALGLYLANWWRGLVWLEKLGFILWQHIQPLGNRLFPIQQPWQAYLLGLVWGWLPCGLVYAVVAWALTTANAFDSAILMFGFGVGTLPAMLITGNLLQRFQYWLKSPWLRASAGAMVIAFGLYSGFTSLVGSQHHPHHADLSCNALAAGCKFNSTPWPAMARNES